MTWRCGRGESSRGGTEKLTQRRKDAKEEKRRRKAGVGSRRGAGAGKADFLVRVAVRVEQVDLARQVGVKRALVAEHRDQGRAGNFEEAQRGKRLAIERRIPEVAGAGLRGLPRRVGRAGEHLGVRGVGVERVVDHGHVLAEVAPASLQVGHDHVVLAEVEVERRADLPQVRHAGRRPRGLRQVQVRRPGDPGQHRDDGETDQEFDQGESR